MTSTWQSSNRSYSVLQVSEKLKFIKYISKLSRGEQETLGWNQTRINNEYMKLKFQELVFKPFSSKPLLCTGVGACLLLIVVFTFSSISQSPQTIIIDESKVSSPQQNQMRRMMSASQHPTLKKNDDNNGDSDSSGGKVDADNKGEGDSTPQEEGSKDNSDPPNQPGHNEKDATSKSENNLTQTNNDDANNTNDMGVQTDGVDNFGVGDPNDGEFDGDDKNSGTTQFQPPERTEPDDDNSASTQAAERKESRSTNSEPQHQQNNAAKRGDTTAEPTTNNANSAQLDGQQHSVPNNQPEQHQVQVASKSNTNQPTTKSENDSGNGETTDDNTHPSPKKSNNNNLSDKNAHGLIVIVKDYQYDNMKQDVEQVNKMIIEHQLQYKTHDIFYIFAFVKQKEKIGGQFEVPQPYLKREHKSMEIPIEVIFGAQSFSKEDFLRQKSLVTINKTSSTTDSTVRVFIIELEPAKEKLYDVFGKQISQDFIKSTGIPSVLQQHFLDEVTSITVDIVELGKKDSDCLTSASTAQTAAKIGFDAKIVQLTHSCTPKQNDDHVAIDYKLRERFFGTKRRNVANPVVLQPLFPTKR